MRWPRLFSKFRLKGGRGGIITVREGDRIAELNWEMLVGDLDMVVYADRCAWTHPTRHPVETEELRRLVRELAADMRINVQLDRNGTFEVFRSTRR